MKIIPLIFCLFLSLAVSAQKNIEATTIDGKTVILKPNGTWEYSKAKISGKRDLSIEAAIIYRSGEVMPVARTKFYLLSKDILAVLKDAQISPTKTSAQVYGENVDKAYASSLGYSFAGKYAILEEHQRFQASVLEAIKPHIVAEMTTDFTGKGSFSGIEAKTYYLFGVGQTRQSSAVWSIPVDSGKETSVILDQNNTIFAY